MERDTTQRRPSETNLTMESLEFVEKEIFLAFDNAHKNYLNGRVASKEKVIMYERALEVIQEIKEMKKEQKESKLNNAEIISETLEIHG